MNAADVAAAWERAAHDFQKHRSEGGIGVVRNWASSLPHRSSVVDLGCGNGWPVTDALVETGLDVHAIDASPTLVASFRDRLPDVPVACETVEESAFFGRTFEGAIAIGLVFLLSLDAQRELIRKVAGRLEPGGRFLFSSPWQTVEWRDLQTGLLSQSPGRDVYRQWLEEAGLALVSEPEADGTHHFDARKA